METGEIIGYIVSVIAGGGVTQFVNWRINKRKAKAEAKQSEIEVVSKLIETVYKPTIEHQNDRIAQLEQEVKDLREEKKQMQLDYEKQIKDLKVEYTKQLTSLEKRMLEISRAVGLNTTKQVRASNGQFVKASNEA